MRRRSRTWLLCARTAAGFDRTSPLGCGRPVTFRGHGEIRNERLRAFLLERGQTPDKLAEHVQVNAKTVERWITKGRIPYRRHRFEVATFLGAWMSPTSGGGLGRVRAALQLSPAAPRAVTET